MKTRVVPHQSNSASTKWCVEYKLNWYGVWHRLTQAWCHYDSLELNSRDFPVMLDYDEAIKLAQSLTEDGVLKWNKEQDDMFDSYQRQLRAKITTMQNKTVEF